MPQIYSSASLSGVSYMPGRLEVTKEVGRHPEALVATITITTDTGEIVVILLNQIEVDRLVAALAHL